MRYEFGGFCLDGDRRLLTLAGREVPLQPKAFELLRYLIEQRQRVVEKDELLEALWPDVVVSDGSLKRAVSLVRSALRQGGAEEAIRTYQRQGYRFCHEVVEAPASAIDVPREAREEAAPSVGPGAVSPQELERLGRAAQRDHRVPEAVEALQGAVAGFARRDDAAGAGRSALHLALLHFEQRELRVGRGWLRRAVGYLGPEGTSAEHGYRAWLESRYAVAEGDIEGAVDLAERAHVIGRRLGDANLEALGLLYKGLALVARGEVQRGCEHQDEAAAAIMSAPLDPVAGGLVYCGMIYTCRNRADWRRAAEWTDRFVQLCTESELGRVSGTCRLHRAELLHVGGALSEAREEAENICDELARTAPWAEGDAHQLRGDLALVRGALDEAEAAYRRAHELGWDPQPGLALLHVARGRPAAGMRSLQRTLTAGDWHSLQRRGLLLARLVGVALAADAPEVATAALEELEAHPHLWQTPALEAAVSEARAALAHRAADHARAVAEWRAAIRLHCDAGAPLDAARARLGLAESLLAAGDPEGAELELDAATRVLDGLGAAALEARLRELCERSAVG